MLVSTLRIQGDKQNIPLFESSDVIFKENYAQNTSRLVSPYKETSLLLYISISNTPKHMFLYWNSNLVDNYNGLTTKIGWTGKRYCGNQD